MIVESQHQSQAISICRGTGFPGPVYAASVETDPANVGSVRLLPGTPSWVADVLKELTFMDGGGWRDVRGVWTSPPEGRILGKEGLRVSLHLEEANLSSLEKQSLALDGEQSGIEAKLSLQQQSMDQQRARLALLADARRLPQALKDLKESGSALRTLEESHRRSRDELGLADRTLKEATRQRIQSESDLSRRTEAFEGRREGQKEAEQGLAHSREQSEELGGRVSQKMREIAARGGFADGIDTVRRDLESSRERLKAFGEPPSEDVRVQTSRLEANVTELLRHLEQRKGEQERAEKELVECRHRFLDVVQLTLQQYQSRVKELARVADVAVEMDLPPLLDDDVSLEEAGIQLRFGFDGKEMLPMGDSGFSGGQLVISGLILLLAMAEATRGGFFLLDEPFAHLSLDRVDQVGRFLRGTRSQFVITAPTTLDRAQLDPGSLVVVLQKKRPEHADAPVPVIAEA